MHGLIPVAILEILDILYIQMHLRPGPKWQLINILVLTDDKTCDPKMAAVCGMHVVSDLFSKENTDCRWVICFITNN